MSAGLDASTTTPGMTAPVVSFTTPAMPVACAKATEGSNAANANASTTPETILRIAASWLRGSGFGVQGSAFRANLDPNAEPMNVEPGTPNAEQARRTQNPELSTSRVQKAPQIRP